MPPIWHLRAFRLWLLLYVPVALLFGYHALASTIEISKGRQAVTEWINSEQQKVARGERKAIEPVDVQFEMLKTDFEQNYERRNIALAFLIAGLAIPGFALLVGRVVGWVLVSRTLPGSVDYSIDSPENPTVGKYLRWYKWACVVAALLVAGLLFAPETLAKASVSALVQALGFVVVAWVFIRLKEWWAWRKQK